MVSILTVLPQTPVPGSVTIQLPPDAMTFAQSKLPAWASGVTIADTYVLSSPPSMPGNSMLREPLWRDDRTGSVLMPIFMEEGAEYAEHGHIGYTKDGKNFGEEVILVNEEGALQDRNGVFGTNAKYNRYYGEKRFALHTPRAKTDTFFFGIAHGGVFMTGLPGERGNELLETHEIEASYLEQLFAGVDRGKPTHQLSTAFFGSLAAVTGTEQETTFFDGGVHGWLTSLIRRDPRDRVANAREIFGRLKGPA